MSLAVAVSRKLGSTPPSAAKQDAVAASVNAASHRFSAARAHVRSEFIFHRYVHLTSLERTRQDHAASPGSGPEDTRIALRQPERIVQVRSLNTQLPVVTIFRNHTEVDRVMNAVTSPQSNGSV